jgi:transposase-like protein
MLGKEYKSILELLKAFPNEQACIDYLETLRWNGDIISPFDSTSKVYRCKGNKYFCNNTGKYFNVKTKTIFENTKIELQKWFVAIYIVTSHKKGVSSLQLSKDIDVTQKTAWFMLQRIRNYFGISDNDQLDNEVEIDETFVGGRGRNFV